MSQMFENFENTERFSYGNNDKLWSHPFKRNRSWAARHRSSGSMNLLLRRKNCAFLRRRFEAYASSSVTPNNSILRNRTKRRQCNTTEVFNHQRIDHRTWHQSFSFHFAVASFRLMLYQSLCRYQTWKRKGTHVNFQ